MTGRSASSGLRRRPAPKARRSTGLLPWLGLIGSIGMALVVTVFAKLLLINFVEALVVTVFAKLLLINFVEALVVTVFAKLLLINFVEMYTTYGKELPWLSQVYHRHFMLFWLGPVVVGLLWYIRRDSWGPRVAGLLGLLIALVGAVSTIFALYLPYMRMASLF